MKLNLKPLHTTLPKKESDQSNFEKFKVAFTEYQETVAIKKRSSEENIKNDLQDLLKQAFNYKTELNQDSIDLSIWNAGQIKVLIETKTPNSNDMITHDNINKKSFHQALFYYMQQQEKGNNAIEYVIITDFISMFLIPSSCFSLLQAKTSIKNTYKKCSNDKDLFYKEIKSILENNKYEISAYYSDFQDEQEIYNLLSPKFLLNIANENDANQLNREFYDELLYIMGLQENDSKLIKSSIKNSLLDLTEKMIGIGNVDQGEHLFEVALGLNILWLNRILFLKILESQLKVFRNDSKFTILDPKQITGYHLLGKLFFNILSTPRDQRHEDDKKYDRIPYLNSSLFEETELEKTYRIKDLDIERVIKIKSNSVLYNDKQFKTSELTLLEYLLRFLNCFSYNNDHDSEDTNTVIKSSVLGMVFEKLNGYKDGSHFTPASITMYMSKTVIQKKVLMTFEKEFGQEFRDFEELKEFAHRNCYKVEDLEKAKSIVDSISILDPAVGSGHFLVSSLNELIRIKSELGLLHKDIKINIINDELIIKSSFGDQFVYQVNSDKKITPERNEIQQVIFNTIKHIIESQLYGIDINPNSVNICRLRLWIELLKHTYYTDDQYIDLEVLPNLEFKVMTANSLLPLNEDNLFFGQAQKETLRQKMKEYYNATKDEKNSVKQSVIELIESYKKDTANPQLENYRPFDTVVSNGFFDSGFMFGINKVDIVLMNPPYFGLQSLAKKDNPYQGKIFDTYASMGDIYQLFMERAFNLVGDDGIVSAIISNKWMRAGYGEGTREWLYKNAYTLEVLDLGSGWFGHATVDTNIISYEKRQDRPYQNKIPAYTLNNKVESIEKGKHLKKQIMPNEKGDSWIILDERESGILEKMNTIGKPLKDWDISINRGVLTGFNEAFIIDTETKDRLIAEDPKSEEIIKPLLRGRDIKRYSYEFADKWLIYSHSDIKENDYPAIKNYLLPYKEKLLARRGGMNQKTGKLPYEWWQLQVDYYSSGTYQDFEKPKIMWGNLTLGSNFSYTNTEMYISAPANILVSDNINATMFLLAVLNSELTTYYMRQITYSRNGGYMEYKKVFIETIPIPVPTTEQEQEITNLVKSILTKKEQSLPTDHEEQQIDSLVYQLYGLTEEEVLLIEKL